MGVALPLEWPVCGAPDTRTGKPCDGIGDGWAGLCRWHGGHTLPPGDWKLLYLASGIFIVQDGGYMCRVGWKPAVALIESGQVRRGSFYRHEGKRLLQRLAVGPVEPRLSVEFFTTLREYEFAPRATP